MPLAAALQNSHQNGGRVFLIFVADPRTVRLCRTCPISYRPRRTLEPETANYDRYSGVVVIEVASGNGSIVEQRAGPASAKQPSVPRTPTCILDSAASRLKRSTLANAGNSLLAQPICDGAPGEETPRGLPTSKQQCRRAGKIDKTRLAILTKFRRVAAACQSRNNDCPESSLRKGKMIAVAMDVPCCATINRRSPAGCPVSGSKRMSNRILAGFVVPQSDCLVHRWTAASRRPVGELQRV